VIFLSDSQVEGTFDVSLFDVNPKSKVECLINDYLSGRSNVTPTKLLQAKETQPAPTSMSNGPQSQSDSFGGRRDFGGDNRRGGGNFGKFCFVQYLSFGWIQFFACV